MRKKLTLGILLFLSFLTIHAQYPNYPVGPKLKVLCRDIHPLTWLCIYDSVSAHLDSTRFATIDTVIIIVRDSIANIYPIPHDSLDIDTLWISADSGLGGGGAVELGDTIGIHVNVDSVTIDILDDTLRVDTTRIATIPYVNDTLSAYWDTTNVKSIVSDSSQYYHWRAVSEDFFPSFDNAVPWNNNQANTDSVQLCEWVDSTNRYNYLEIKADTNSTGAHHAHLHFNFIAPRATSSITDTLFIIQYWNSVADTDSVGIVVKIYEGVTEKYDSDARVASASWTNLAILKTDDNLSDIVAGDRFSLSIDFKTQLGSSATINPENRISLVRLRWW